MKEKKLKYILMYCVLKNLIPKYECFIHLISSKLNINYIELENKYLFELKKFIITYENYK